MATAGGLAKGVAASLLLVALTAGCATVPRPMVPPEAVPAPAATATASRGVTASASLVAPIIRARERVTKKQYGTQVSPSRSPVSPERFTGFHTGVDFEIFPGEENADVPVAAACDGTVLLARYVGGYGGVLVQSCTVAGQAVTVLYGHLRLASITAKVGDGLRSGDRIAVLGTGYSAETDQERRHLHLAVHRGSGVELRGYVSTQAQLAGWIDPLTLLP